jgi:predicted TIM-barrel fold metal-dependent hydrolase
MARVYGVPPTLEGFDSVVSKHIGSDAAFARYVTSILDRERVTAVVFEARGPDPVHPRTHIPAGRFVWTYELIHLVHPEWAQKNGITSVEEAVDRQGKILETAVANGCVGFKSAAAYYRPLGLGKVDARAADAALTKLLQATPAGHVAQNAPFYTEPALDDALRTYQDYIYKRMFTKAGELERPVIIHTAVALHPALRFEFNNPLALYDVFQDDEIRKAATQFVLIHTGYPNHDVVAAMLSQFPNVYADMSFYAKFPGVLEETYRAFLALAPSEKIMHGSDSNNVPEEIGYCASNTRRVLARILNDYRTYYGWTQADVRKMADNVMHRNARRVFRISS